MYHKNLEFFKERVPGICEMLQAGMPIFTLQVEKIATGNMRVSYNAKKCLLHSEYSIEQEMEWMLHKVVSNTEIIVVFGLGAGYCIKAIINTLPHIRHIIVVEPSLQIFETVMGEQNFAKLLAPVGRVQVSFVVNQSEKQTMSAIQQLIQFNSRVDFIAHLAYRSLFSEYYQRFYTLLIENVRHAALKLRTLNIAQELILGNTLQNLAVAAYSCESLQKMFQHKSAVIVSAGPSLQKNMHLLSEAKDKAIIIAVGTAIQILNKAGIRPDFYAAMDPHDTQKEIFQDLRYSDVPLLFTNQFNATIVAEYRGSMVRVITDVDCVGQYIYDIAGIPILPATSGASVASIILSLLCNMKCSTVIFIGQDICLQNNQLHALGVDVCKNYSGELLSGKDIFGADVKILPNYWMIKAQLESIIAKHPETVVINATEGGVGMRGAENERFADVLAIMKPFNPGIDGEISGIIKEQNGAVDFRSYLMQGCLHDDIDAMGKILDKSLLLLQANAVLQEDKSVKNKKKIDKNLLTIKKAMGELSQIKFCQQVVLPSMEHILITVSNLHQSGLGDPHWDVRIKAATEIWGAQIIAIMWCCSFVKERLSTICSDI